MNLDEKKIEEAGLLIGLDQMAWIINLVGGWPIQRTLKRNIIFAVYLVYHNLYLVTSYSYLVIVFGNLELMTGNLMESAIQSMSLIRLVTMNLSPQLKKNIFEVRQNLMQKYYEDSTEKNLYDRYYLIAKKYCTFTMIFTVLTSFNWYLIPIQTCAISWFLNKPVVFVVPYKVHLFFNVSSIKRTVILYIFQSPLQYPPICCAATINVNVIIITNICGQMAIFSHRIKKLKTNDSSKKVFNNIVNKHLELVRLTKNFEESWTIIFGFELVATTILCALVLYNALMAVNADDKIGLISLVSYVYAALLFLFANCLMGELLKFESENLMKSLYICDWYNMSINNRRALLICMTRAQLPLEITAGKFYVYSYNAYIQIIKSAMAYVSMLRTLTM